jgi:hypothetical protein
VGTRPVLRRSRQQAYWQAEPSRWRVALSVLVWFVVNVFLFGVCTYGFLLLLAVAAQ